MKPIVRFAPSPTGYLHIGGARTALVNYAFAKVNNGKFLLRIEDTDKERSTDEYIETIYKSLEWLDIKYDDLPIQQSKRCDRHVEIAKKLLQDNKAYYCFCSSDELENQRKICLQNKMQPKYNGKCKLLTQDDINLKINNGEKPTIRINVSSVIKEDQLIKVNDIIKGSTSINVKELDDFVILRSDETPVYMLSVVVDDHDMNITHVIRGDDHFTNSFRQIVLYKANDWKIPEFAHLPLIYGPDGKKLSKRFHAVGTDDYKKMGYLAESLKIYLATMGCDTDKGKILNCEFDNIIQSFDLKKISKSITQFDINFLNVINQKLMKNKKNKQLCLDKMIPFVEQKLLLDGIIDHFIISIKLKFYYDMLDKAYDDIVSRCKNFTECAEMATIYFYPDEIEIDKINVDMTTKLYESMLYMSTDFSIDDLKKHIADFCIVNNYNMSDVLSNLRNSLTGRINSPNIYNIIYCIGKNEVVNRLKKYVKLIL